MLVLILRANEQFVIMNFHKSLAIHRLKQSKFYDNFLCWIWSSVWTKKKE